MIKKGVLDGPFSAKPEHGPLPTLLSYMVSLDNNKPLSFSDRKMLML